MLPLSIVILTKNEEKNIARCLQSVRGLSNDILVLDSGSKDRTIEIANSFGAKVVSIDWKGYGATKNEGNRLAANDWILSLDADEEMNDPLKQAIINLFEVTPKDSTVFALQRIMVYCGQVLRHGAVSCEFRIRLFNRNVAKWNQSEVHEQIEYAKPVTVHRLKGWLWHHSYATTEEHLQRLETYAQLSAKQMRSSNTKVAFWKQYLSPVFHFTKNYFFKGGFLDGRPGFDFAKNEMYYVKRKYLST